jgi:predicted nucleic acid-binding protein
VKIIVDASIAFHWIIETSHSSKAEMLLRSRYELVVPDLIVSEATNIVTKAVRLGQADAERVKDGLDVFARWFNQIIPSIHLHRHAAQLAFDLRHSAYDCFYLAVAEHYNLKFVTLDQRLIRASSRHPISKRLVHLTDWEA